MIIYFFIIQSNIPNSKDKYTNLIYIVHIGSTNGSIPYNKLIFHNLLIIDRAVRDCRKPMGNRGMETVFRVRERQRDPVTKSQPVHRPRRQTEFRRLDPRLDL